MKTITRIKRKSAGFVRIIIIIIVVLVVASFFGLNPQYMWSHYLGPIFSFIWDVIVTLANFLFKLLKLGIEAFNYLLGLIK
jgi:hypothetical protein